MDKVLFFNALSIFCVFEIRFFLIVYLFVRIYDAYGVGVWNGGILGGLLLCFFNFIEGYYLEIL